MHPTSEQYILTNMSDKRTIYLLIYQTSEQYTIQLWTFYEVNMLYMDLLRLY